MFHANVAKSMDMACKIEDGCDMAVESYDFCHEMAWMRI